MDTRRQRKKAAKLWYVIHNPKQALVNELLSEKEAYWLEKLLRLGLGVFAPLTLSIYLVTPDIGERVAFLKEIETFIFLNLHCGGRKSSLGNSHFPYMANNLYNKKGGVTIQKVLDSIQLWTKGNDEYEGYFSSERFVAIIKDQFTNSRKSGYYDWSGVRYLLYEYEEYLQKNEPSKVKWKTPNSIEHIFPQDDADPSWKANFRDFNPKQKKILCNSLGNLVLLRGSKNSQLSNRSFDFKKRHPIENDSYGGYHNGSHSEIEVSQYKDWDAKNIYKRGKRILDFLQERWGITLNASDRRNLLLADESLIEKVKAL